MRILIAGCGYVGGELARRLVEEGGHDVLALRRRSRDVPAGATPIGCDLTDASTLRILPDDIDAVVYAVGADSSSAQAYADAYVRGLANLGAELRSRASFPRRVIVVTSTAVYAQDDGSWVDETSAAAPAGFGGRTLLESEAVARSLPAESIIVRFGGIYGPGRTRLVDSVREGSAKLAEVPEFTNRIHRDDCAGVLAHLLALDSPADLYLGVDDEPADRRVVVEWMARRLGVAPPSTNRSTDPLAGTTALPIANARGKRCSNRRLRASGYAFRFPTFRDGYETLIAGSRPLATRPAPA